MSNATQPDSRPLSGQIKRVFDALSGGQWLSLIDLHSMTGDPVASISSQIRHLKKKAHGSHDIRKRRRGAASRGLYEYHLENVK